MISVFAPDAPARPGPRIWNEQLIRYAGYDQPNGRVLGDPRYRSFTERADRARVAAARTSGSLRRAPARRGDRRGGTADVPAPAPRPYTRSRSSTPSSPGSPTWACAGTRSRSSATSGWSIGGVSYPAAPFNGWYMGTEIGARNLGDTDRYDLVPTVAERMGLDTSDEATLWRDRALVELNRAVLHSFDQAGVTITDHHTESRTVPHPPGEGGAGGPPLPGRLELDRAADVRLADPGLPPLLRHPGPAAELLRRRRRLTPGARGRAAGLPLSGHRTVIRTKDGRSGPKAPWPVV